VRLRQFTTPQPVQRLTGTVDAAYQLGSCVGPIVRRSLNASDPTAVTTTTLLGARRRGIRGGRTRVRATGSRHRATAPCVTAATFRLCGRGPLARVGEASLQRLQRPVSLSKRLGGVGYELPNLRYLVLQGLAARHHLGATLHPAVPACQRLTLIHQRLVAARLNRDHCRGPALTTGPRAPATPRAYKRRGSQASGAERRRNRTYPPPGYDGSPVLKTGWGTSPVPLRGGG
jgi:hypothetical protein